MADQLYLSVWFPNFRLEALPGALVGVLRQFALISSSSSQGSGGSSSVGDGRVTAASAYPLGFTESPVYQRIYVHDERAEESAESEIEYAVAEATEQLHEDMAYEFEMRWGLWAPVLEEGPEGLEAVWKQQPYPVKVLGFGPEFDNAGFEQNGHIRVDFGLDTPWILEDTELDEAATKSIQKNIEMLLAFTLSVEKHCGISSRLLWTESGEPLAEKLIGRLQRVN
jgi:hypothetical protein